MALVSLDGHGGLVAEQTVAELARVSRRAARALHDSASVRATRVHHAAARSGLVCRPARGDANRRGARCPGPISSPPATSATGCGQPTPWRRSPIAAGAEKVDAIDGPAREPARSDRLGRCRGLARLRRATGGRRRRRDCRTRRPRGVTHCSCTSPAAPSVTRRWSSTRRPTASVTCPPPASGTTCGPVIATGRSPTRAGPRPPGAACSARWHERPRPCPGRARQTRRRHDPEDPEPAGDHLLLRPAHALPAAGPGRPGAPRPSGLRHCTSAGEPLNPEVIRVWKERDRV